MLYIYISSPTRQKNNRYNPLEMDSEDNIQDVKDYPQNNPKIVVFDDLQNANEKIQNKIANHFTNGRHQQISPIYLSQSYYYIPKKLRLNCFD